LIKVKEQRLISPSQILISKKIKCIGAWRSLVAHSFGVRVVGRSNRLAPTIIEGPWILISMGLSLFSPLIDFDKSCAIFGATQRLQPPSYSSLLAEENNLFHL
jgi:hypothetical protein